MDWNHALTLLMVIEKAIGHPKLKPLVDAAAAELEAMDPTAKHEEEE